MEALRYPPVAGSAGHPHCSYRRLQTRQSQKRHGRIFFTDPGSPCTAIATLPSINFSSSKSRTSSDEKRYGQVFLNPLPSMDSSHSRIRTENQARKKDFKNIQFSEKIEVSLYTIEETTARGNQKRFFLAQVDKRTSAPKDELDQVRRRLRSINSFDDMLVRGFLVDEKRNRYELTVRFSLTPKIARDGQRLG
ncbi:hypothetical protein K7432_012164 [Basidiobolus ranarum]|uniref:Uncharacterized protein n=1 Tax=Basidiobolus ranarum TaxID=34480 RepID=A0ABR2VTJ7_9FUNG